jgi:type IV pilus assembly protein PilX
MNTLIASTLVSRKSQSGAVLIVSMLLLLVLTVLAIGASQTTRLEERMAWNARDTDLAFQAAEAGLRAAEKYISITPLLPTCVVPASATCYVLDQGYFATTDLTRRDRPWWEANGKAFGTSTLGVAVQPRYVIEEFQFVPFSLRADATEGKTYYKSTAWSPGGTETSHAVVESVFSRE